MKNSVIVALFVVAATLSAAQASQAQPRFVSKCADKGLEKLRSQAEAMNLSLNEDTMEACEVDNRFFNPSKYVWYCATATAEDGAEKELVKLVQYYLGKCY